MDDLDLIGLGLDDLTEDTGTVEVVSLDEEIAKELGDSDDDLDRLELDELVEEVSGDPLLDMDKDDAREFLGADFVNSDESWDETPVEDELV